jgi:hypothetical protein
MKKIIFAHFRTYRNELHDGAMLVVRDLCEQFPKVRDIIIAYYRQFLPLLDKEGVLLDAMQKSDYTKQIEDADHRVDRTMTGFKEAINPPNSPIYPPF